VLSHRFLRVLSRAAPIIASLAKGTRVESFSPLPSWAIVEHFLVFQAPDQGNEGVIYWARHRYAPSISVEDHSTGGQGREAYRLAPCRATSLR